MNRTLLVVSSCLAFTALARAQTFTGDFFLDAYCGSTSSGALGGGCAEEQRTVSGTCSHANCGTMAVSTASHSRFAGPGALASTVTVDAASLQSFGSGCGSPAGGNSTLSQRITATDLVFRSISNPGATGSIFASCNFEFRGSIAVPLNCAGGTVSLSVCAGLGVVCSLSANANATGYGGALAGYPGDGSVALLATQALQFQLGQPTTFSMSIAQGANPLLCEAQSAATTHGQVAAMLTLPRSGPVFTLPPDITVDSAQFGIVDNQWVALDLDDDGLPDACEQCPPPATYCTAKTNSAGCVPAITSSGVPSASAGSGFVIGAAQVLPNASGILLYSKLGPGGAPFQSGFLCATQPFKRTPLQTSSSSGAAPCTGAYAFDFNALVASGADPALIAGVRIWSQYWTRDGASPSGTGLTNGLTFLICP